jgi:hypothetical protein
MPRRASALPNIKHTEFALREDREHIMKQMAALIEHPRVLSITKAPPSRRGAFKTGRLLVSYIVPDKVREYEVLDDIYRDMAYANNWTLDIIDDERVSNVYGTMIVAADPPMTREGANKILCTFRDANGSTTEDLERAIKTWANAHATVQGAST